MRNIGNPYWEAGYEAYHNMIAREMNPHDKDSDKYELWLEGYNCADSDCDDN